jgi:hypothetical protein
MTLPQVTGDLLNALLRIVKELGLPLLFAAILLLVLPPWIAAAVYLSFPLLLAIVILLASIAVFAPAPWLVRIVTRLATWVSAWALYLSLNDARSDYWARSRWWNSTDIGFLQRTRTYRVSSTANCFSRMVRSWMEA